MDKLTRWLGRNEVIGWAGVAVGVAQLLASLQIGWLSLTGIGLAISGFIFAVGLFALTTRARRQRYAFIEANTFQVNYEFQGNHGELATLRERALLRASTAGIFSLFRYQGGWRHSQPDDPV